MASGQLKFGLSQTIIADLRRIFGRYPEIEHVIIFGSRAKGGWKEGSDIDLAVISATMSDGRFTQLWNDIDSLPMVFKVDCVHWDKLSNLNLKNKIALEGQAFYP